MADPARIRCLLVDCDGTLTAGGLGYDAAGAVAKVFHVRDGHRMVLAPRHGLAVGVVSGRDDPCLRARAADLGCRPVLLGVADKVAAVDAWRQAEGLAWDELAAIGDDLPDEPLLAACGLGVAVADAHPRLRQRAGLVLRQPGGGGAVAECIERLLRARGWNGAGQGTRG